MKSISILIYLTAIFFFFSGCTSVTYKEIYPTLNDGNYDSEFPYKSSSKQLEEISNTVKLINSIAFYKYYVFEKESKMRAEDITEKVISEKSIKDGHFNQYGSGTATIIYQHSGRVALLTCAHIVDFPDTLYSYFPGTKENDEKYIQTISIKDAQSNYIAEFPEGGRVEILMKDDKRDIAILTAKFDNVYSGLFKQFHYPLGRAGELDWGTFVYMFGYPMNYKMITKGIVSNPNKDGEGTFILDAVSNRGSSGGIVIAIRDGIPNFEMVGIVKAVPSEPHFIIRPDQLGGNMQYNPHVPYEGDIFADRTVNIRYGITVVIPAEKIVQYLYENRDFLADNQIFIDDFLNLED